MSLMLPMHAHAATCAHAQEYKPEVIQEALDMMTCDNVRITWVSKKLAEEYSLDQSEPW